MVERVERAVSGLFDGEVRRHREIPNDRVERSIAERALTGEESLALHERLGEEGVAITFDKEEDETVADDTFPGSEEAKADQTVSRDFLRACLAEIAARPLLTSEEEAELARKIGEARRAEQALAGGALAKTPEIIGTIEAGLTAKRSLALAHMRLVNVDCPKVPTGRTWISSTSCRRGRRRFCARRRSSIRTGACVSQPTRSGGFARGSRGQLPMTAALSEFRSVSRIRSDGSGESSGIFVRQTAGVSRC